MRLIFFVDELRWCSYLSVKLLWTDWLKWKYHPVIPAKDVCTQSCWFFRIFLISWRSSARGLSAEIQPRCALLTRWLHVDKEPLGFTRVWVVHSTRLRCQAANVDAGGSTWETQEWGSWRLRKHMTCCDPPPRARGGLPPICCMSPTSMTSPTGGWGVCLTGCRHLGSLDVRGDCILMRGRSWRQSQESAFGFGLIM